MDVFVGSLLWISVFLIPIGYFYYAFRISRKESFKNSPNKFPKIIYWLSVLSPAIILFFAVLSNLTTFSYKSPCIVSFFSNQVLRIIGNIVSSFSLAAFLLPIALLFVALMLWFLSQTDKEIYTRSLFFIIIGLVSAGFLLLTFLESRGPHAYSKDARRVADIRQIQLSLELYASDHIQNGKFVYPRVVGNMPVERLGELRKYLVSEYIAVLPEDPCFEDDPGHQYDYQVSPDGADYVLRAILKYDENPALNSDKDGIIYNIDCRDEIRAYCVVGP